MTNSSLFHSDINVNLSFTWLDKGTTPWAVIGLHFWFSTWKYTDYPLELVSQ